MDTAPHNNYDSDDETRPIIDSQVGGGMPTKPKKGVAKKVLLALVALALVGGAAFLTWYFLSGNKSTTKTDTKGGQVTIKYMVHWLEDQQINGIKDASGKVTSKGLQQYVDEYQTLNPNVKIEVQQVHYNDYADTLRVMADSGSVPDIYQIYAPWGAEYVRADMLAEAPEDIKQDVTKNYISYQGATIEGKIWGIPTEINNYALLYNKDLFKQAGIVDANGNAKAPETWADVISAAKKLTKKSAAGAITQYGIAFSKGDDWQVVDPFLSLLYSNEGKYLSDDLKKAEFNSEEGVAALNQILQLFKDGSTDVDGSFYDFKDGKVGMVIAPPWTKSYFASSYGAQFSNVVGVSKFPYLKTQSSLQYSWFTGVTKDSKNQDESWKFLKWFTSENQASGTTRYGDLLAGTIGAIPARKVDFEKHQDVLGDFFTGVYVNQMNNSKAEPNVLQSSAIKQKLMSEIEKAWAGDKTAKEALDSAALEVDKTLKLYY